MNGGSSLQNHFALDLRSRIECNIFKVLVQIVQINFFSMYRIVAYALRVSLQELLLTVLAAANLTSDWR